MSQSHASATKVSGKVEALPRLSRWMSKDSAQPTEAYWPRSPRPRLGECAEDASLVGLWRRAPTPDYEHFLAANGEVWTASTCRTSAVTDRDRSFRFVLSCAAFSVFPFVVQVLLPGLSNPRASHRQAGRPPLTSICCQVPKCSSLRLTVRRAGTGHSLPYHNCNIVSNRSFS